MNSKSLRRLAADHGSLHTSGLPPNYLFDPNSDSSDMLVLDVWLAGPDGTPYAEGAWHLRLDIPPTYPNTPPTATFTTKLWHPNIDPGTGAVCVETLKRDWSSSLKLRDVLVTISCLLIQPNPASALNEEAGKLASEDWNAFCRRAKMYTGMYGVYPPHLAEDVREARMRGEEKKEEKVKEQVSIKGKEKVNVNAVVNVTPPAAAKVREELRVDDEENRRRRGDTVEVESDPESDWIPGPTAATKTLPISKNNIFGIKGLEDSMQLDTPPRVIPAQSIGLAENADVSDPFITVSGKHSAPPKFALPHLQHPKEADGPDTTTPDLLKFSHRNPFSAIQPNNQTHPLFREFSWSWEESEIMHDTGTIKDGPTKTDVRKRMAGDDFEKQRRWEMKKFKKTGYDMAKYNRGDFGPRTGIGRL